MKLDLHAIRRVRTLNISKPGEWVSIKELVESYNNRYRISVVSKLLKKLNMHDKRMLRTVEKMVVDGYYEYDPEISPAGKPFRFVTKTPNSPKKR